MVQIIRYTPSNYIESEGWKNSSTPDIITKCPWHAKPKITTPEEAHEQ